LNTKIIYGKIHSYVSVTCFSAFGTKAQLKQRCWNIFDSGKSRVLRLDFFFVSGYIRPKCKSWFECGPSCSVRFAKAYSSTMWPSFSLSSAQQPSIHHKAC